MNKAERTKQLIVEKTAPLFNTKGYAGTSISDMTEATGLTKGSIYGNFENKDDVALAAFDHNYKKVRDIIRSEMEKKRTIKEKLLVYTQVYDNYMHHPFPHGGCPILNTAIEADDTHAALKKKAADAIHSWKTLIISLVEKGIASGEMNASLNPEQFALTFIAMIEGAIMMAKVTGKPAYRSQVLASVKKFIEAA